MRRNIGAVRTLYLRNRRDLNGPRCHAGFIANYNPHARCHSSAAIPRKHDDRDRSTSKPKNSRRDDRSMSTSAISNHAASAASASPASTPAPIPEGSPPLDPIDFGTASVISGDESQILEVKIGSNQLLRAESGAMLYMTQGIQMETSMGGGGQAQGGLFSTGLARVMTGQNLMVSDFTYRPDGAQDKDYGVVGLGTDFPAKILRFELSNYPLQTLVCQKGAFLAGSSTVAMDMAFAKSFATGFFGGEGFVLQSLRGTLQSPNNVETPNSHQKSQHQIPETVFLKGYGTVVHKTLEPNQTLRVTSGSLIAMTSTIDYDITTMSGGFKNVVFGGEGLFVTTLRGPGEVWLQGMPMDRMCSEIARRVPSGGGLGLGVPIMGGGGGGGEGGEGVVGDEADNNSSDEGTESSQATDAETGLPLTEDAVEADRNATIMSSGFSENGDDADNSPSSLFGDAADPDTVSGATSSNSSAPSMGDSDSFQEDTSFSNQFDEPEMHVPEFEEPAMTNAEFDQDTTEFSTYDNDEYNAENNSMDVDDDGGDDGPSLLRQIWDFFSDMDDD